MFFFSILAVSLVLMGLTELLWLIFGEPNVPWAERKIWHAYEIDNLFPKLTMLVNLVGGALFIIYPIYIGMGYFGGEFQSDRWHGYVLRATLVFILGAGFLVTLPKSLYVIMCKNIADGTRSRIFISQLAQSVIFLMFVSLFLSTQIPNADAVPIVGKLIAFTPIVLYITLGYVVMLLIIPYLIGHYRYKEWTAQLDGDGSGIVNELLVGVRSPIPNTAKEMLVEVASKIDENLNQLARDKSYRLAEDVIDGKEEAIPLIAIAAEKSVQRDPRFIHAKELRGLRRQISDCLSALASAATNKDKLELLKNFGDAINQQTESQIQNKRGRPLVLMGITSIVLAVINPFITALSKTVASVFGLSFE